jgi:hypothetical protein
MQDLLNPQKWMGFLDSFKSGNVGEILILFFIVIFIFIYFLWDYMKNNSM